MAFQRRIDIEVNAGSANATLRDLGASFDSVDREAQDLQRTVDRAGNELTDYSRSAQTASRSTENLQQNTQRLNAQTAQTARNTAQAAGAVGQLDGGIGRFSRSAGQAGIQIQQFVGQVSAGTSATVALSQQAADLGIVLGLPLVGAVVGIASALAGPFLESLFDSSTAIDALREDLQLAREDAVAYAETIAGLNVVQFTQRLFELEEALDQANIELERARQLDRENIYSDLSENIREAEANVANIEGALQLLNDTFGFVTDNVNDASRGTETYIESLDAQRETIGLSRAEVIRYEAALRSLNEEDAQLAQQTIETAEALAQALENQEALTAEAQRQAREQRAAQAEARRLQTERDRETQSITNLIERYRTQTISISETRAEAIRYSAAVRALEVDNEELANTLVSVAESAAQAIERQEDLTEQQRESERQTRELEREYERTYNSLNDGITDAIVNFNSLEDVATSVARNIARAFVQQNITTPLLGSLGFAAPSTGGSGGIGGFNVSGNILADIIGGAANIPGISGTGIGNLLGGAAGQISGASSLALGLGGLGGGLLGGAIGGEAGSALGGIGGSIGAAFGPVGAIIGSVAGGVLGSFFGGEDLPPGFEFRVERPNQVSGFASRGRRFGATSVFGGLGFTTNDAEDQADDIAQAYSAVINTFVSFEDTIAAFLTDSEISAITAQFAQMVEADGSTIVASSRNAEEALRSFTDLRFDVIAENITSSFSEIFDEAVARAEEFAQEGEITVQTVGRLIITQQAVTNALDQVGVSIEQLGDNSIEVSQELTDLFGNIDQLGANLAAFNSEFVNADEEEAFGRLRQGIFDALGEIGVDIPQELADVNREFFTNLVQNATGTEQFAQLLGLTTVFDAYLDTVESAERGTFAFVEGISDLDDALDSVVLSLDEAREQYLTALTDQVDQLESGANRFIDLAASLREAQDSLITDSRISALSPENQLSFLQARFDEVAQLSLTGDADALEELPSLSQQLLSASRDFYGQSEEFYSDFNNVQQALEGAASVAEAQVGVDQQQLNALNEQIDLLRSIDEALGGTAASAAASALTSLGQAVAGGASGGANASQVDLEALVSSLYVTGLGRSPDAAGLAFWVDQFRRGGSFDQVANAFFIAARQNQEQIITPVGGGSSGGSTAGSSTGGTGVSAPAGSENTSAPPTTAPTSSINITDPESLNQLGEAIAGGTNGGANATDYQLNRVVDGLYRLGLGRLPDTEGYNFWFNQLRSGGMYDQVKNGFFTAAEQANEPVVNRFANGGLISGPGTGLSDSIQALVSNGEFITNAAATASNLDTLTAINNGQNLSGIMQANIEVNAEGFSRVIEQLDSIDRRLSDIEEQQGQRVA